MSNSASIRVEGLWKQYGLSSSPSVGQLARSMMAHLWSADRPDAQDAYAWALRDVSFEVKRGETVGIVGRNGAGKSTLLKVLAGVTPPTRGRVEVRGRVFPMIELNAGVHPELTGRENIYLLGAIMGISRMRMTALLPQIEEFVELGDWFERPVRTYSSGMVARLGFGVATRIESDILLIDETFAVGDLRFQNKSLARVKQMRESGATIVLVSHNLDLLQHVAQRCIVLDKGTIVAAGMAVDGVLSYERSIFTSETVHLQREHGQSGSADVLTIHNAFVYTEEGVPNGEVVGQSAFGLEVCFTIHRLMERPLWSIGILNSSGVVCVWNVSGEEGFQCDKVEGRYRLRLWYRENKLAAGAYRFNFILRDALSFETTERVENLARFVIINSRRSRGIVIMSPEWALASESITI